MRLTVVGCAGSFPSPASPASCYLVEAPGPGGRPWRLVLDLGNGAVGPLQRYAPLDGIDAVLLSHLHPDHCTDLTGLHVARHHAPAGPAEAALPLYGPSGTAGRLRQLYGTGGSEPVTILGSYDVRPWVAGVPVRIGPVTVTPFPVEHPVEAYGLRLETDGRVLAYTGDTDTCDALVPLARDADLFLAEASFQEGRDTRRGVHLTGLRAGEAAARAGAGRLLLTHVPVWTDPDVVLAEARSAFPGPVELARPGAVHVP